MKEGENMLRVKIIIALILFCAPGVSMGQEVPKRPWGQVYREDLKKMRGVYQTSSGFYINGVRVNAETYTLYQEMTVIRFEVQRLREEVEALKRSLESADN
jgi:hypothetical protein